jgi:hypothetical protein
MRCETLPDGRGSDLGPGTWRMKFERWQAALACVGQEAYTTR